MPQATSSDFQDAAIAPVNDVTYGFLVAWDKTYNALADFFTIGTSSIEGDDFIKGAGDDVTFFDKYNFLDESSNVKDITISRMSSLVPYGAFSAQANVTMDNTSKRYMPGFDPDIGTLVNKNRRPIKIAVGFDGENPQQFVGFSDRPRTSILGQEMVIHAYDVMDYFATAEPVTKTYTDYKIDEIIEDVLIDLGFNSAQFNIEVSLQTAPGFISFGDMKVLEIFNKFCEAEQALMFVDELGVIQFWNRQHYAGLGFTITDPPVFDYTNMEDVAWGDTPIINWMIVNAFPREVAAIQPVFYLSSPKEIPAGESIIIPVKFEDDDGALPVTSLHDPVYITAKDPSNRSYYTTNLNQDGSGATGDADITVTDVSLLGDTAFIEFTNSGGSPVYLTYLELQGTPAKVADRISVEYKDDDSIEAYGINPESNSGKPIEINNDWIQDSATAFSLAKEQVDLYSDPEQQISSEAFGDTSRQFGDLCSVKVEDVDDDYRLAILVGTETRSNMSEILKQNLVFEYRDRIVYQQLFTINVSEIGGIDALAS